MYAQRVGQQLAHTVRRALTFDPDFHHSGGADANQVLGFTGVVAAPVRRDTLQGEQGEQGGRFLLRTMIRYCNLRGSFQEVSLKIRDLISCLACLHLEKLTSFFHFKTCNFGLAVTLHLSCSTSPSLTDTLLAGYSGRESLTRGKSGKTG